MTQRTGLPTIRETAAFMCKLLTGFIPIIKRVFPDETSLHAALEAARLACCLLVEECDAVIELGD